MSSVLVYRKLFSPVGTIKFTVVHPLRHNYATNYTTDNNVLNLLVLQFI